MGDAGVARRKIIADTYGGMGRRAAHAAVGIDDDLAPGHAGVAHRAADDEAPGRVDEDLQILVHHALGHGRAR